MKILWNNKPIIIETKISKNTNKTVGKNNTLVSGACPVTQVDGRKQTNIRINNPDIIMKASLNT
jgi:hypothetical protein